MSTIAKLLKENESSDQLPSSAAASAATTGTISASACKDMLLKFDLKICMVK